MILKGKVRVLILIIFHCLTTNVTKRGIKGAKYLIVKIFTASLDLVKQKLRLSCIWLTDMFSVDAIRGLEDMKQRLKRSATVGEVEDVATGRQLMEIGGLVFGGLVILLTFLLVIPPALLVGFLFVNVIPLRY